MVNMELSRINPELYGEQQQQENALQKKSSCCPWTRKTCHRVLNGTYAISAVTSLFCLIYGYSTGDYTTGYVGAAGLPISSFVLCAGRIVIFNCTEDDFQERIKEATEAAMQKETQPEQV